MALDTPNFAPRSRRSRLSSRGRALVLAMQGQYSEAASLLLSQLPIPLSAGTARHRREASVAATYLEKAGRGEAAERLRVLLGTGPRRTPPPPTAKVEVSPRLIAKSVPFRDALPLAVGTLVAERFRLEAVLGRGGMAVVYRARDLELEEDVALKVFTEAQEPDAGDSEGLRRFRRELKLARQLVHPNIVRVYDIGVHQRRRYITMELLTGTTLYGLLGAPVDLDVSLSLLAQACEGLGAAHDQGVVHRDVKSENLFVTEPGAVKVMDFGIARHVRRRGLTLAGTTAGTPEYMAPEQINNFSTVGPAADQYSLGVVAYELLTGQLPFDHEELLPLFFMHLEQPPLPLREVEPSLPTEVEAVVLRMLAKDPADRFRTCRDLGRTLLRLRDPSRRA